MSTNRRYGFLLRLGLPLRLNASFRATNRAGGPVKQGKNWPGFRAKFGRKRALKTFFVISRLDASSLGAVTVRERIAV
jgi:hypothetical protein